MPIDFIPSLTGRNRYILECKVIAAAPAVIAIPVEIDTFWNVKKTFRSDRTTLHDVEIDTFWNVKFYNFIHFTVASL